MQKYFGFCVFALFSACAGSFTRSPPLSSNTTATICVGHHAVTLLRHSAYDGSRSVAADVAGPLAAINESCAAVGLLPQTSFKSNCVECEKHD